MASTCDKITFCTIFFTFFSSITSGRFGSYSIERRSVVADSDRTVFFVAGKYYFFIVKLGYFICSRPMTAAEIADLVDEIDDSDADPDYNAKSGPSDSSDSDNDGEIDLADIVDEESGISRGRAEIRITMQPAVERPDADTDVDSGRNYNTLVTYPVDALTFRPLTFHPLTVYSITFCPISF